MPTAKLRASGNLDSMKPEDGNDSLDTLIRQTIGKEPFLSFSRPGESSVQWIQLLHALDQQDLPGWPLLSPFKIQMQKCDKCSMEFSSPINYRRHIRVHRRSLNIDKASNKNRDLLGAYWDKLQLEEAKKIVSFEDVKLKDVPGPSIINDLTSFIRKPGFCVLPQPYARAGSALLDIIQATSSRLPISSKELFSILDDASERTFLCAGTAESMPKYVFAGEPGKNGFETKNLIACTSFVVEQKLVRAWLADKDAEALRCQKLLVEEEEAAQIRQAELLEKKRQKKLRQKEQRAKERTVAEKVDLKVTVDTLESLDSAETSSPAAASESDSGSMEPLSDYVQSLVEPVPSSNPGEAADTEPQCGFHDEPFDSSTCQNVDRRIVHGDGRRNLVITRWQVPKSQRGGRNGFHTSQNQVLKFETVRKHGASRDYSRTAAAVNGHKVWTRKPKSENDGETLKARLQEEAINQTDQDKNCEVMIGSISVALGNCTSQKQDDKLAECQYRNCSMMQGMPQKNIVEEKPIKPDCIPCGTSRSTVKLWRPVSRHEITVAMPVQSGQEFGIDVINEKTSHQTLPNEGCPGPCVDNNGSESGNNSCSLLEGVQPEGLPFSIRAAKVFLAQRWKEAITGDHVKLVVLPESEPPGCPGSIDDCQVACPSSDLQCHTTLDNVENGPSIESIASQTSKSDFRSKPEKGIKIKYIPKQRTVA